MPDVFVIFLGMLLKNLKNVLKNNKLSYSLQL